jgi:hypothetical protein
VTLLSRIVDLGGPTTTFTWEICANVATCPPISSFKNLGQISIALEGLADPAPQLGTTTPFETVDPPCFGTPYAVVKFVPDPADPTDPPLVPEGECRAFSLVLNDIVPQGTTRAATKAGTNCANPFCVVGPAVGCTASTPTSTATATASATPTPIPFSVQTGISSSGETQDPPTPISRRWQRLHRSDIFGRRATFTPTPPRTPAGLDLANGGLTEETF